MRSVRVAGQASLAVLFAFPGIALAQSTVGGGAKVTAEALFETARKLVAEGKYVEACPKFADSQRLDPSPSTLLNLASCSEKLGQTARAWATYREAESSAAAANRQDYVAVAKRHADALAPKLSRLTITVARPVVGMDIMRDGELVSPAQWGVAIPVDRGQHALEASARGFKGWATQVQVTQDGSQVAVTVPPLETLPVEPASLTPPTSSAAAPTVLVPPPQDREAVTTGNAQRAVGVVVGSSGLVGLGVSGVLAWIASSKNHDSLAECPTDPNVCTSGGVALRSDAIAAGNASTVAFGVGAAALVTGVVLWLTASHPQDAPTGHGSPLILTAGLGGAGVAGTWP
jgi:hypothetical protein